MSNTGPAMAADEIMRRVEELPYGDHKIELRGGVTTLGMNSLDVEACRVPAGLTGKRVLDVGAWKPTQEAPRQVDRCRGFGHGRRGICRATPVVRS